MSLSLVSEAQSVLVNKKAVDQKAVRDCIKTCRLPAPTDTGMQAIWSHLLRRGREVGREWRAGTDEPTHLTKAFIASAGLGWQNPAVWANEAAGAARNRPRPG